MNPYSDGALHIEALLPQPDLICLRWTGRSQAARPERMLHPYLQGVLERAKQGTARIEMSFAALEYLNSSTVAVLVQFLLQTRGERVPLRLRYQPQVRWQKMSFEALKVFEQLDRLVEVVAEPNP